MRYGPKKLVLTTHAVGGSYYRTGLAHDAAAFQKKSQSSERDYCRRYRRAEIEAATRRIEKKDKATSKGLLRLIPPSLRQKLLRLRKAIVRQQPIPLVRHPQRARRDAQRHARDELRRQCFRLLAWDARVIDRGQPGALGHAGFEVCGLELLDVEGPPAWIVSSDSVSKQPAPCMALPVTKKKCVYRKGVRK